MHGEVTGFFHILLKVVPVVCLAAGSVLSAMGQENADLTAHTPAGRWRCYLQGGDEFRRCGIYVEINRLYHDSLLAEEELELPLNISGVNLITLRPSDCYMPLDLLMEYPAPDAHPVLLNTQGGFARLEPDSANRRVRIFVTFQSARIRAHLSAGRTGGRLTILDRVTGESKRISPAPLIGIESLKTDHPYEVTYSARWYPVMRHAIRAGEDTSFFVQWLPLSKAGLIARSVLLPGWGHWYARRRGWWWSVGVGGALVSGAIFKGLSMQARHDSRNYSQLCNDSLLSFYCVERNRANERIEFFNRSFRASVLIMGGIWAAGVSDALFFWVDPWGTLTGIEDKKTRAGVSVRF